jgi:hypothetical protein
VCARARVCVSACLPACVLACVGLSVIAPTPYKCVYIGLLHTLHVCMFMCLCAYEDYITDKLNRSLSPLSFSPLSQADRQCKAVKKRLCPESVLRQLRLCHDRDPHHRGR